MSQELQSLTAMVTIPLSKAGALEAIYRTLPEGSRIDFSGQATVREWSPKQEVFQRRPSDTSLTAAHEYDSPVEKPSVAYGPRGEPLAIRTEDGELLVTTSGAAKIFCSTKCNITKTINKIREIDKRCIVVPPATDRNIWRTRRWFCPFQLAAEVRAAGIPSMLRAFSDDAISRALQSVLRKGNQAIPDGAKAYQDARYPKVGRTNAARRARTTASRKTPGYVSLGAQNRHLFAPEPLNPNSGKGRVADMLRFLGASLKSVGEGPQRYEVVLDDGTECFGVTYIQNHSVLNLRFMDLINRMYRNAMEALCHTKLISYEKAASILGVSSRTVYDYVAHGRLRAYRVYRFKGSRRRLCTQLSEREVRDYGDEVG